MCKLLTNGIQIQDVLSTCILRLIGHSNCHVVRNGPEDITELQTSWGGGVAIQ